REPQSDLARQSRCGRVSAPERGALYFADALSLARRVRGRYLAALQIEPTCCAQSVVGSRVCYPRPAHAVAIAAARAEDGQEPTPQARGVVKCGKKSICAFLFDLSRHLD